VKPGTDKILARAFRALSAAERALGGGAVDVAAARCYSAMIAAAKALLNEKGLRPISHAAIATAFEKHASGPRIGDELVGRLRQAIAYRARMADEELAISFDDVRAMVDEARDFVETVQEIVRP
jgi:uncharacterized protein (UPF0332 family)